MECKARRFVINAGAVVFGVVHTVGMKGTGRRNHGPARQRSQHGAVKMAADKAFNRSDK